MLGSCNGGGHIARQQQSMFAVLIHSCLVCIVCAFRGGAGPSYAQDTPFSQPAKKQKKSTGGSLPPPAGISRTPSASPAVKSAPSSAKQPKARSVPNTPQGAAVGGLSHLAPQRSKPPPRPTISHANYSRVMQRNQPEEIEAYLAVSLDRHTHGCGHVAADGHVHTRSLCVVLPGTHERVLPPASLSQLLASQHLMACMHGRAAARACRCLLASLCLRVYIVSLCRSSTHVSVRSSLS